MPQIRDHADLFRDWESLIAACLQAADLLPGQEEFTSTLGDFLTQAKTAKAEQEQQEGLRKTKTQFLDQTLDRGREAARKVRRFILTRLDSRDERLTQFGITPSRTRKRKAEPTPTPVPEAAKPAQETASAPPPAEKTTNPPASDKTVE